MRIASLGHVVIRVRDLDRAQAFYHDLLEGKGLQVAPIDHVVTKSIYLKDPDGNAVELYVDGDESWRENPALILSEGGPLEL